MPVFLGTLGLLFFFAFTVVVFYLLWGCLFLEKMPFFFTSPPAEWWFFCFSDGDFFVLGRGDFFVLATVFFVLVVVHLTNKLPHTHTRTPCMFSSTWRCLRHLWHYTWPWFPRVPRASRRAFWSCRPWRVSALIHVLGLCQAAAARLGAFEDEDIDGWVFVGVAVLGGYGAIFWTTAMSRST